MKLDKTSGIEDNELFELIDEIGEDCSICLKYKKALLKPVVGLSLSKQFNDIISMDSKEINGHKILHIVDHATHFSSTSIISKITT